MGGGDWMTLTTAQLRRVEALEDRGDPVSLHWAKRYRAAINAAVTREVGRLVAEIEAAA